MAEEEINNIGEKQTSCGFIAIIGRPNAGKSTLLNAIMQTKLSIVTKKPQTTRKNVLGIYSDDDAQFIFLDTPGLINARYEMQERMMSYVANSLEEADVLIVVADLEKIRDINEYFSDDFRETIKSFNGPKILLLNKIDILKQNKDVLPILSEISESKVFSDIIPCSALNQDNIESIIKSVKDYLPKGPFLYDPEQISTQTERFFVSEKIREQIFKQFQKELPYSTEAHITEFAERENGKWYISADIIVESKSQKIILVGKGGRAIKKLGQSARFEIEDHLQMPVFLELFVKVRAGWRDNDTYLKSYGY